MPLFIAHRINNLESLLKIPNDIGLEIDIRENNKDIVLAHDPFMEKHKKEKLIDMLPFLKNRFLIVNIKTERIEKKFLEISKKYIKKDNYFFLDSSFSVINQYRNNKDYIFCSRYSEYESLKTTKEDKLLKNKDLIGFVGGPWTILVYMLNKKSPKKNLNKLIKDKKLTSELLEIITDFLCVHIKNQVKSGASVIQIFDSWAGLVKNRDIERNIYNPTKKVINFIHTLKIPAICFPRNIDDYKEFVDTIKPDVVNIDYRVNPVKIVNNIKIPIQGGLDPKILLTNKKKVKIEAQRYLDIFKNHPYIFNLGHGVLPQTNPDMVEYLINTVKNFK